MRIYLYGSWAAGKAGKTSDIDIAVLPLAPLPKGVLSELRQTLEESNVLYSVDLVDLSEADETFRPRTREIKSYRIFPKFLQDELTE